MSLFRCLAANAILMVSLSAPARAQIADNAPKADAERAVQAYLAMWSSDKDINAASVTRFYAPRVIYYGKAYSRTQVLDDKKAYIRQWPIRRYTEVPGSFTGHCNPGRTLCKVNADMTWRRVSRSHQVSIGRARLSFDFVPVEGNRKIARESAQIL